MNEQYANSIFSNLTKLFGFPSKNFDFNGTLIKGDPDGYEGYSRARHESDDEWGKSIRNGNPEIQEQSRIQVGAKQSKLGQRRKA